MYIKINLLINQFVNKFFVKGNLYIVINKFNQFSVKYNNNLDTIRQTGNNNLDTIRQTGNN